MTFWNLLKLKKEEVIDDSTDEDDTETDEETDNDCTDEVEEEITDAEDKEIEEEKDEEKEENESDDENEGLVLDIAEEANFNSSMKIDETMDTSGGESKIKESDGNVTKRSEKDEDKIEIVEKKSGKVQDKIDKEKELNISLVKTEKEEKKEKREAFFKEIKEDLRKNDNLREKCEFIEFQNQLRNRMGRLKRKKKP